MSTGRVASACACITDEAGRRVVPCEAHRRQHERQHVAQPDGAARASTYALRDEGPTGPFDEDFAVAADMERARNLGCEHADLSYLELSRLVAERFSDRGPKALAEMQRKAAAAKRHTFEAFN